MKYNLYETSTEIKFKDRRTIRPGITYDLLDCLDLVATYNTLEEAKEELSKRRSHITQLNGVVGFYFLVEEFYIAECDDEENEEVIEFSTMEIEVVEKPSYKTVEVFDNYADAEDKLNELEDGFISFC